MEQTHPTPKSKKTTKLVINSLIVVLVIAAIGILGYYGYTLKTEYDRIASENAALKDPTKNAEVQQQQVQEIVAKLGKIIKIDDTDKQPAVATITDVEKLKASQPEFYKNAQKDDYLIVYPNRAIIYRDQNNQIINIAPIIQPPADATTNTNKK
jgi:flagellar basal body-associated protein FliL